MSVSGSSLAVAVFFVAYSACAQPVRVESGLIEGIRSGTSTVYKSIPFAAAPVAGLRWRAPQPPQSWSGVRQACQRRLKIPHFAGRKFPTPEASGQCRKRRFRLPPFPHLRNRSQNGPERSRARRFCAAQRTLDGEDRSERLVRRERGLVWFLPQVVETNQPCGGPLNDNSRRGC